VVFGLLVIEDYVGGALVGRIVKGRACDGDLSTRNFHNFMTALFYDSSLEFSVVDVSGYPRTFRIRYFDGDFSRGVIFWNRQYCDHAVRVRFGSGSTPPLRTDYRLASEFLVVTNPEVRFDAAGGFVYIEAGFTDVVARDVCEVGLTLVGTVYGSGTCGEVLLDRTVFSPCRSIPANTPYVVRYRLFF